MNFEQLYELVDMAGGEMSFTQPSARKLYETLEELKEGSTIVEVGVDYGRSTTVMAYMAKEKQLNFFAFDYCGEKVDSKQIVESAIERIKSLGLKIDFWPLESTIAAKDFQGEIDLIHIDATHTYESVKADIKAWAPKVKINGYMCFHDYGRDSLPGVKQAVDEYLKIHSWTNLGGADTFQVFKRK